MDSAGVQFETGGTFMTDQQRKELLKAQQGEIDAVLMYSGY